MKRSPPAIASGDLFSHTMLRGRSSAAEALVQPPGVEAVDDGDERLDDGVELLGPLEGHLGRALLLRGLRGRVDVVHVDRHDSQAVGHREDDRNHQAVPLVAELAVVVQHVGEGLERPDPRPEPEVELGTEQAGHGAVAHDLGMLLLDRVRGQTRAPRDHQIGLALQDRGRRLGQEIREAQLLGLHPGDCLAADALGSVEHRLPATSSHAGLAGTRVRTLLENRDTVDPPNLLEPLLGGAAVHDHHAVAEGTELLESDQGELRPGLHRTAVHGRRCDHDLGASIRHATPHLNRA